VLSEAETQLLRRKLLDKGQELAQMLSDLLAGNPPPGVAGLAKPGETPEEALRRYLGVIQQRIDAIAAGTGYGLCERCGAPLSFAELDEMPWADTCRECASK
jgi:hypothetical protein